jgi:nitronate monooxygenase
MYPCSNPNSWPRSREAASASSSRLPRLRPQRQFASGLDELRRLTQKPLGLNVLTESSLGSVYGKRMIEYVDVALAHGIRFFVTALGDPKWVVEGRTAGWCSTTSLGEVGRQASPAAWVA